MFKFDLQYKRYFRELEKDQKLMRKRLAITCRNQLKRSTKRLRKEAINSVKKNTNLKMLKSDIIRRYTRIIFSDLKDINYMQGVISFQREGINLIRFVVGRIRATKQKGIPVRRRRSPYVSVYKGAKTKVKRGFIIKKKTKEGHNYVLLRRKGNKAFKGYTPSIVHLLEKTGFNFQHRAKREQIRMLIKIMKRKDWFLEPIKKNNQGSLTS